MGKIQVGQKSPKTIDMGGFTVLPNDVSGGAPESLSLPRKRTA